MAEISEHLWQLQNLWVGIGCQKGSSLHLMERAIEQVLTENQLDQRAIAGFATINTKATETGLVELCRLYSLPLKTFTPEMLSTVCVPNPAKIIETQTGTPSVAEAAAILAASHCNLHHFSQQPLLPTKIEVKLLIPKQIFRLQRQPGVITLAVAQQTNHR